LGIFGLFFLAIDSLYKAHHMDQDGIILNLSIKPVENKAIKQDTTLFLETSDGESYPLYHQKTVKKGSIKKLVLLKEKADLKMISGKKSYTLIKGIDPKKRQELTGTLTFSLTEKRFKVDVDYHFSDFVNFDGVDT